MTRKLYDENAYTAEFTAHVLSCREEADGYAVVLDATAFFPEGGGQASDTGTLDGAEVTHVRLDGETVVHLCRKPLTVDSTVTGKIHWTQRFSRMQQHSGEHLLSGLIFAKTGFHNMGFHMGADCTTVDVSGKLSREEIDDIVREANAIVQENRPIRAWYPDEAELKTLPYRSKKEIAGAVRLVEIAGADLCACCAPHVSRTGEIGPVLIISRESFHGGTRLGLLCGKAATEYLLSALEENRKIATLLSAKPLETYGAVSRMAEELGQTKLRCSQTAGELYEALAEQYRNAGDVRLFRDRGDAVKIACAVAEACKGRCDVFVKTETGYRYALCRQDGDLRNLCRELHESLGGKGGGKGSLVQGSTTASRNEIEEFFRRRG